MTYDDHREQLTECPWCSCPENIPWGRPLRNFIAVECLGCGLVYVKNRLNATGLQQYYNDYLSRVHQADETLNRQREAMYKLEFDFIRNFISSGNVLDVGCSNGGFTRLFQNHHFSCEGVEFGSEAAAEAARHFPVHTGELPDLAIDQRYDLIIFRGVIEHVTRPRTYLTKAHELLNPGGFIFITSTPNVDSVCAKLFKEQWNQHIPEEHIIHFAPRHFDAFFADLGMKKISQYFFYEETPYANPHEDILNLAAAINKHRRGEPIDFRSPPFWGNMMSLIYQKA